MIDIKNFIVSIIPSNFYRVTVVVDTNDADYIEASHKISGEDVLNYLIPVIEALNNPKEYSSDYKHYNWWNHPWANNEVRPSQMYYLTSKQVSWFNNSAAPYAEDGFHTIEKILISDWIEPIRLF